MSALVATVKSGPWDKDLVDGVSDFVADILVHAQDGNNENAPPSLDLYFFFFFCSECLPARLAGSAPSQSLPPCHVKSRFPSSFLQCFATVRSLASAAARI